MIAEALLGAVRLLLWALLFAYVMPRLTFAREVPDGPTATARIALLTLVCSAGLWAVQQLSVSTFVLGVALAIWTVQRKRKGVDGLSVDQVVFLKVLQFLHIPAPLPGERVPEKGAPAPGKFSVADDAKSTLAILRQKVLEPGRIMGTSLASRAQRVSTDMWGSVVGTAALAIGAVLFRFRGEHPLSSQDEQLVLQREGWVEGTAWLPDLAATELAEQLVGLSPAMATVLTLTPILFIHGITAAALLRRLAPSIPSYLGSLAMLVPCLKALAGGEPVEMALLIGPTIAWACWSASDAGRKAGFPLALAAASVFLGAKAGALCALALLLGEIARGAESRSKIKVRWSRVLLLTGGLSGLLSFLSFGALPTLGETTPLNSTLVTGTVALSCWLLATGAGHRDAARRAAVRGFALTLLATTALSGQIWPAISLGLPVHLVLALAGFGLTLVFGQLVGSFKLTPLLYPAPLSVVLVAAWISVGSAQADDEPTVGRDELNLISEIEEQSLPWDYTVVAGPKFLPAIAGRSWYVDERQVAKLYPAHLYEFHPEHPDRILGTSTTYIVTDLAGQSDAARWVQDLRANGVDVEHASRLKSDDFLVFSLKRDREKERQVQEEWFSNKRKGQQVKPAHQPAVVKKSLNGAAGLGGSEGRSE